MNDSKNPIERSPKESPVESKNDPQNTEKTPRNKKEIKPTFWPIDVMTHAELGTTDPTDRTSFKPVVNSGTAHIIYAYNMWFDNRAKINQTDADFTEKNLRDSVIRLSQNSQISPHYLKPLLSKNRLKGKFYSGFEEISKSVGYEGRSLTIKQTDVLDQQLNECSLKYSRKECCQATLAPWLLGNGSFFPTNETYRYSLVKTKAWLTACSPVLNKTPVTIQELKLVWGDYENSPSNWVTELHPLSLAKRGGRRVYRKKTSDNKFNISVSQTLTEGCEIEETEVIYSRGNQQAVFLSYDHHGNLTPFGIFPSGSNKRSVKSTPESCMGCHYKFDTRRFNVIVPSFKALNLILGPSPRNDKSCAKSTDEIIWHDALYSMPSSHYD